jgi:hypothetical protein
MKKSVFAMQDAMQAGCAKSRKYCCARFALKTFSAIRDALEI